MSKLTVLSDGSSEIQMKLQFAKGRSSGVFPQGKKKVCIRIPPGCKSLTTVTLKATETFLFDPPLSAGENRTVQLNSRKSSPPPTDSSMLLSGGTQAGSASSSKRSCEADKSKKSNEAKTSQKKSNKCIIVAENLTGEDVGLRFHYAKGSASGSLTAKQLRCQLKLPAGCLGLTWCLKSDKSVGAKIDFPRDLGTEPKTPHKVRILTPEQQARADLPPPPPSKMHPDLLDDQTCDKLPFFTLLDDHKHPHLQDLFDSLRSRPKGQQKFVDPTFDLSKQNVTEHEIEWLRPSAILGLGSDLGPGQKLRLFEPAEAVVSGTMTVKQGKVGNCWLIATMACMYNFNPLWMQQLIPVYEPDLGIAIVRFHKMGRWRYVLIDDQLPTIGKKLCYASHKVPGLLWGPLLEKAYAKIQGGYANIEGGHVPYAVTDLSGHMTHKIDLGKLRRDFDIDGDGIIDKKECVAVLECLKARFHVLERLGIKTLCLCFIRSDGRDKQREDGLIAGHAYAILSDSPKDIVVGEGQVQRLVHLRNPWGRHEWNGAWSDDDPLWQRPDISRQQSNTNSDDGRFWMPCEEFVRIFEMIHIIPHWDKDSDSHKCRHSLAGLRANVDVEFGEWPAGAGGNGTDPEKWAKNPQFWFRWKREDADLSNLDFMLFQTDHIFCTPDLGSSNFNVFPPIALQFWKAPPGNRRRLSMPRGSQLVACAKFQRHRQITAGMGHLPPGEYIVVPVTMEPFAESVPADDRVFVLTVCASEHVDIQPLQAAAAEWDGADALREMLGDNVSDDDENDDFFDGIDGNVASTERITDVSRKKTSQSPEEDSVDGSGRRAWESHHIVEKATSALEEDAVCSGRRLMWGKLRRLVADDKLHFTESSIDAPIIDRKVRDDRSPEAIIEIRAPHLAQVQSISQLAQVLARTPSSRSPRMGRLVSFMRGGGSDSDGSSSPMTKIIPSASRHLTLSGEEKAKRNLKSKEAWKMKATELGH